MIQQLIYERFGVYYNVFYIAQLLKNLGFSYQKAAFVSDHLNESKRSEWRPPHGHRFYAAQAQHALLLFGDEASFPQWGTLTYTWARRGQQPMVKTSGKRKGYKVFGLIEYFTGRFFYQGQEGRLNSAAYIAFLQRVLEQTTQPIVLIQDGARYHTSTETGPSSPSRRHGCRCSSCRPIRRITTPLRNSGRRSNSRTPTCTTSRRLRY